MSKIEWTDRTWNPLAGCSIISKACDNCYAMKMAFRLEHMGQEKYKGTTRKTESGRIVWTGEINIDEKALLAPLKWKKPQRVFVNSMSDLFHEAVPFDYIDKVFAVMALTPHITYQILTKRPKRMREYFEAYNGERPDAMIWNAACEMNLEWDIFPDVPFKNVWLGTTVEDQKTADERIPHLLKCPAEVRFLSCEPLLGPIDLVSTNPKALMPSWIDISPIHWVIVGGESGSKSRPSHPDWFRSLRDQCEAAQVPFFFKQWGEWTDKDHVLASFTAHADDWKWLRKNGEFDSNSLSQPFANQFEYHVLMVKAGKATAGNLLDGKEWNEFPDTGRNEI